MARDKSAHHERIIAAAREEFMTYGFTDASMRRIAAAAGYVSSAHFSHLFKKMTGIAPSDWRAPDLFSIKDPIDFTGLM